MKLHEALSLLGDEYVSGTAEYFSQFEPDPWYEAYNKVSLSFLDTDYEESVDQFVKEFRELIAQYKASGKKVKGMPWNDGFYSADVRLASDRSAMQDKTCTGCETDTGLVPLKTKIGYVPICKPCKVVRE